MTQNSVKSTVQMTERTRLGRRKDRARYERDQIYAILDEGLVAYVGFFDGTSSHVLPMAYGRCGDFLVLHGSRLGRLMNSAKEVEGLCVNVSLIDGLIFARSAFHHSVNYRSVSIYGAAQEVVEDAEKIDMLRAVVDHTFSGRWEACRPVSESELFATTVLKLPLDECVAKVRSGPPVDDKEDLEWNIWAGVVPVQTSFGEPVGDAYCKKGLAPPTR